jgi:NADH-quinone oxidoreductase subunit C
MIADLRAQFPQGIIESAEKGNQFLLTAEPGVLLRLCRQIKEAGFTYPADMTAVDDGQALRAVYRLYSMDEKRFVVISVPVARKGGRLASVSSVWSAMEWFEREVSDLFGITFDGHPDPRPILLPKDWEGHPLLKDYPPA